VTRTHPHLLTLYRAHAGNPESRRAEREAYLRERREGGPPAW